ncbi:hypothetical protein CNMCM5793_005370 [Aspergillus hiratsukae]|uniref:C2H2-type domain-containing protein n=1 Tax=Aspergillus hiratsukae TaxID=1194566 RepID=A0A8H6PH56_9EURO|nr:hypothetical protein CNMCM5793_005370 [Aspergillus hiratsukae]KAF7171285.1 hypothetical protein CNMCM6106_005682 [Aspergillus hiratsukae]
MKMMCGKYICSHLMCQTEFDSETQLHYHLSDTHGLHKAIWVASGNELDSKGKIGTRTDAVSQGRKRSQEWTGAKKQQRLGSSEAGMFCVIHWTASELNITTPSTSHNSAEAERQPDGSTLVEDNCAKLTPVQVAQHHPVPSPSNHLATPFREFGEMSLSSADGRLGQLCKSRPGFNADGIRFSTQSPSLQPDSIADTLNTSSLPTLYTSDERGPSTTNTSPEIPPIDPRLMQDCDSSILSGHEPGTSEDRERSDSSYATCSPDPNTPPTSLKLRDARSSFREAPSSADMTVSPVRAHLEASTPLTAAPGKKALKKAKHRTVDNDGVHANHRLTRAMMRRKATDTQSGHVSCPKSSRAANHPSKKEEVASIPRHSYVAQPSSRVSRSTSRMLRQ